MSINLQRMFGIPIAATTMRQVLDRIDRAIERRERLRIGIVNAAKIVNMQRDALLARDVLASDMILADGMAVVWASRVIGRPLPERVTGIDLMYGIFERGKRLGYRVYCLGATDDVLNRVVAGIAADYPGVNVVGHRNGYFTSAQEAEVAADIAAARPDVLLVAMTSPKKENFMGRWADELHVPVCHGVGGSFDVMAGKVQRAPELWQRLGLEWLYRVKQEPRRLWRRYLVTNTLFVMLVVRELFHRGSHAYPDSAGPSPAEAPRT
jgi:N-acetylglucosaminyldiphosphoundecaprenol N-acetyl-beta-D-mannosaminyltransferase